METGGRPSCCCSLRNPSAAHFLANVEPAAGTGLNRHVQGVVIEVLRLPLIRSGDPEREVVELHVQAGRCRETNVEAGLGILSAGADEHLDRSERRGIAGEGNAQLRGRGEPNVLDGPSTVALRPQHAGYARRRRASTLCFEPWDRQKRAVVVAFRRKLHRPRGEPYLGAEQAGEPVTQRALDRLRVLERQRRRA